MTTPANRELHEAMLAYLAAHANDPRPEPEASIQAVLFASREGETEAEA